MTNVLDGQQRLTAIFGVFQTQIAADPAAEWAAVYFDLGADRVSLVVDAAALGDPEKIEWNALTELDMHAHPLDEWAAKTSRRT